jgi:uncharacterized membrane protein
LKLPVTTPVKIEPRASERKFRSIRVGMSQEERPEPHEITTMRKARLRFTIGQLMILIAAVALLLGIAARAYSNPSLIAVVLVSLIVLGPVGLQLYAIFWRDQP